MSNPTSQQIVDELNSLSNYESGKDTIFKHWIYSTHDQMDLSDEDRMDRAGELAELYMGIYDGAREAEAN